MLLGHLQQHSHEIGLGDGQVVAFIRVLESTVASASLPSAIELFDSRLCGGLCHNFGELVGAGHTLLDNPYALSTTFFRACQSAPADRRNEAVDVAQRIFVDDHVAMAS
jgi:hypothetical protein